MSIKEAISLSEKKMESVIDRLDKDFASIRAGRANPSILDKVMVDYYGSMTPIRTIASVSVSEARILIITPFDMSALKAMEKAIIASDIGINPTSDGKALRLVFPQLTEERRKDLAKQINKYGEEAKISIRNARRDGLEKLKTMKKNSEITEDELKTCEKDMQKLTDKNIIKIDELCKSKEKELMTV